MAISANSRYTNNVVTAVTEEAGSTRLTIMSRLPNTQALVVSDYTWDAYDRPDLLAARAYGDETMWWVIANANPQILDWTSVSPGTVVRVPSGNA